MPYEDRPVWVCTTCGNHYPETVVPPPGDCVICADERQWVPPTGQRWATLDELRAEHRADLREIEPDLLGVGVEPPIGIGHRGLLVRTEGGNLLWDPPAVFDDEAAEGVRAFGGIRYVTASHPHMYGAIVEWSREFGADILLPEVDAGWLTRPSPDPRTWSGSWAVLPGVTLVQCGGHFPGSAALHWAAGADGAGALFVGDTVHVTPGEDRITFAWSAPNRLPMPERAVRRIEQALRPYAYDRIYAGWWQPVLRRDAKRVLAASSDRYVQFLRGEVPTR